MKYLIWFFGIITIVTSILHTLGWFDGSIAWLKKRYSKPHENDNDDPTTMALKSFYEGQAERVRHEKDKGKQDDDDDS